MVQNEGVGALLKPPLKAKFCEPFRNFDFEIIRQLSRPYVSCIILAAARLNNTLNRAVDSVEQGPGIESSVLARGRRILHFCSGASQRACEELIDWLGFLGCGLVGKYVHASNILCLNAFGRDATGVRNENNVLDATITSEFDAARDVDGGTGIDGCLREKPMLIPIDVDAMTAKVDEELIKTGTLDQNP